MDRFSPAALALPIVQAPLAGGPSTPALAVAVSAAGGLGFLAAGYKTADAVAGDVETVRAVTEAPFGVNVFVPDPATADTEAVARYAATLQHEAGPFGEPRSDDDDWEAKLELLHVMRPAVASFTFGCPSAATIAALQQNGIAVWVTITTPTEARAAAHAGADALVVQGAEAGGHRGSFDDAAPGTIGLLPLLQLAAVETELPLIATGGIMTGAGIAAVLAAGASAAQLGSALMLTPEAGTSAPHRERVASEGETALTRAFSGRTARGIVNRFQREHDADAPSAYPEVHHLTAPLRAAARTRGDAEAINLWAGQAHALAQARPAGELVQALAADARAALCAAAERAG
ncbi:MAG TPA: nitronate monooxygenase [Conexibacter sp.]|jgi:nitronate monooxygenase|nr:nitronate monooxygenase [Conexibacter sp.]